jgi:hypothetical protein
LSRLLHCLLSYLFFYLVQARKPNPLASAPLLHAPYFRYALCCVLLCLVFCLVLCSALSCVLPCLVFCLVLYLSLQ